MHIAYFEIQNYRKLKHSRISLTDRETVFVGSNNSGKTSAMDALIFFLGQRSRKTISDTEQPSGAGKIIAADFTLSNWNAINEFGITWLTAAAQGITLPEWQCLCPSLDIWLDVKPDEIHRVSHLIPTLKWAGGTLGVRLVYQPKDIGALKSAFLLDFESAAKLLETAKKQLQNKQPADSLKLSIWPSTLHNYLEREISRHFEIKAYILDPAKAQYVGGKPSMPQLLTDDNPSLPYPFNGLFKVDIIDAARGFSDPNSSIAGGNKSASDLASQINKYYNRHLNPSDLPGDEDLDALRAIADAQHIFDERLNNAFSPTLGEIKNLGYPGFNDPSIRLSSRVNPIDNLDHEASILFDLQKLAEDKSLPLLSLSEKYNGLGYKNLIAMVFRLVSFRDQWMRVGKAAKRRVEEDAVIEPLHLVLIEEPEAHLHAQVQQVFIRKAFDVLRNHPDLKEPSSLTTQMVVSTHSSYLAHEIGFERLRYFKRKAAKPGAFIPTAEVVDLAETFGETAKQDVNIKQTAQFVARYLKSTHCDLFFANGIILVEGAAERMLIPHFIRKHYDGPKGLNRSYISILEVGGAHAHRLKALIEKLGIPALVITDTDALEARVNAEGEKLPAIAVRPERNKGYKTGSHTLKNWICVADDSLDAVLDLGDAAKTKDHVHAVYQCGIQVDFDGTGPVEALPYTFEDAIALTNPELFRNIKKPAGMIGKMQKAFACGSLEECCKALFVALKEDKAAMALDLMFCEDPDLLAVPKYIKDGLDWLQIQLEIASKDITPEVILAADMGGAK
ncbi:AAA family ATPase [Collimonas pratensis]|uniref:AAA ATPase domain protein n=1 Tax=Collimonas pratensis TaxID=279113 RepID=A0A127Q7Y2_9BURK|nr:AAA family ATPase [Collimonas pratensis]AMP06134.1 AAA ATPase domain protein [Collimonas pratensis]